jgi:predicted deacetylase
MKSIISIHDVMPETMDRVLKLIEWLEALEVPPSTLLVVPGKDWTEAQIKQLDSLSKKGYTLAAHGWRHKTRPRRIYHRLHSLILSRDVAEHLDLSSTEILDLIQRSKAWFLEHNLPAPDLYVPPAWALGPIRKKELSKATYQQIETTLGVIQLN